MKKDSFSSFRKVAAVALVLIGLVFAGCEKEIQTDTEIQDNNTEKLSFVSVKSGMACFKNEDDYIATINILATMSEEEKDIWENKIGLKTIRRIQNEILDELENISTLEGEKEFVKLNHKFIEYKNIDGETYLDVKYNNPISNAINNEFNMYIICDSIYKRIENFIVCGEYSTANLELLKSFDNVEDIVQNNFKVYSINHNQKSSVEYSDDAMNEACNKKVIFTLGYEDIYNGTTHYTNVYHRIRGYKYYWGSWHKYKSHLTHNGTNGKMNFPYYLPPFYNLKIDDILNFSFAPGTINAKEVGDWVTLKSSYSTYSHSGFIDTHGSATNEDVIGNAVLNF